MNSTSYQVDEESDSGVPDLCDMADSDDMQRLSESSNKNYGSITDDDCSKTCAISIIHSDDDVDSRKEHDEDNELMAVPTRIRSTTTVSMKVLNRSRRLLYISHFFAQFSESAWQFALILFLAAFVEYQSLIYVSTYGIMSNAAVCLFSSTASTHFIDRSRQRLRSARYLIWIENTCVIIASVFCYLLLRKTISENNERQQHSQESQEDPSSQQTLSMDWWTILYLVGIHFFGPVAQIFDGVFLVAMERDLVVVMGQAASNIAAEERKQQNKKNYSSSSSNDNRSMLDTRWLTETNVTMKQIDLSCKVLSPAIAGYAVDAFGYNQLHVAAAVIGIINIVSLIVEYICTELIYTSIPELASKIPDEVLNNKKPSKLLTDKSKNDENQMDDQTMKDCENTNASHECGTIDEEKQKLVKTISNQQDVRYKRVTQQCCLYRYCNLKGFRIGIPKSLLLYVQQPVSCAGLGNALLYFNALTFGGLMSSYLLYRGMDMSKVGFWRGVSALIGLIGTYGYKVSIKHMDVVTTGMWSIVYQLICISFSMASMFIEDKTISIMMFVLGVCASRIGLYSYKIAVTQLMQLNIPAKIRGTIGGTQNSLNAFFQLLSFGLCLIYSNPKDFVIVVAAGYVTVIIASILYGYGIYHRSYLFVQSNNVR